MTILFIILVIIAIVAAIVGILGAILPVLPGPPLNFAALFLVFCCRPNTVSLTVLIVMLILTVLVTVLDYIAPAIVTKMGGGSSYATKGSILGVIAGLFFMPLGLILGPIIGAFIGELLHGSAVTHSLKVAALSFISFLLTTGFKLLLSLVITYYTFAALWHSAS